MNISPKDLAEVIGCSVVTLDKYICRFPQVKKQRIKGTRFVEYTNVTDEIKNGIIVLLGNTGFFIRKNKKEAQYDKYYHIKNNYNQCAADCFDFNFSYDRENKNTCFSNYDNPCKCKVLSGEYCEFLAAQKGEV